MADVWECFALQREQAPSPQGAPDRGTNDPLMVI